MAYLQWEIAEEINEALAHRFQNIHKRCGYSQQQLSQRGDVSYASLKRFEITSRISLLSLTRLALALNCGSEIRKLFAAVPNQTIEEVIREPK